MGGGGNEREREVTSLSLPKLREPMLFLISSSCISVERWRGETGGGSQEGPVGKRGRGGEGGVVNGVKSYTALEVRGEPFRGRQVSSSYLHPSCPPPPTHFHLKHYTLQYSLFYQSSTFPLPLQPLSLSLPLPPNNQSNGRLTIREVWVGGSTWTREDW